MEEKEEAIKCSTITTVCLALVIFISSFTYLHNYQNPNGFFWDETYHVASAQKYINNIFFMEQHPPLGKMLIALGEQIFDFNEIDNQFIDTDHPKGHPPKGFSFAGYRIIPAILGWLVAPMLFLIFLIITRSPIASFLLSGLYVFDNALIVHMRGAMLEGPLIFFIVLSIFIFLLLFKEKNTKGGFAFLSFLLGISIGLSFMTKLTGLIVILLIPALIIRFWKEYKKILTIISLSSIGFFVAFVSIWQIHFALGDNLNPELKKDGWYFSSTDYQTVVKTEQNGSLRYFPAMLKDSLSFHFAFNDKVPKLDFCKPDENGSPYFMWPFGARAIRYRWSKIPIEKEDDELNSYRYLYLLSNPIAWGAGLLGIILSASYLISGIFFARVKKSKNLLLIGIFLTLYICFMIAMSNIDRVMYLYHYFPALIFSFILFGLIFNEIGRIGNWNLNKNRKTGVLLAIFFMTFSSFLFFKPLTYFQPLTKDEFNRRNIFKLWNLKCIDCKKNNYLVNPSKCEASKDKNKKKSSNKPVKRGL
ncbi:phospholipid carrier-dependent glycosyltransferase [Candidatus Peribacteria bacterium]|jgi:dolichyl-phosphate-mannose-protein mannosyltransferase|nr:phospholipid carrier-dependent glycosyltransferase [Candidatus Peribacteria bacterium]MBT4021397.1 phospholipid carrier-dependent glycosyltransferase [Candidatus Peribacteria bacterium]MBT4241104.1 phospholipid carrier-dependent glycosyltransferase [Candidatus Peribacteria bacterium]MBT4474036.1 phospholipid carrier-dependent glycosyltransferase [Candidatus Peribacteria bacterium]